MKTILHCDMNNFFASVEMLLNPSLKDFPIAVAGNPIKRTGIILAKNYNAKAYGVKTGEAIWEAKVKCPTLVCVAPQYDKYEEYSKKAREIYGHYTDKIEPFGMDECWLDVTASLKYFNKTGRELAKMIQDEIFEKLGLTISIGVSFSKTLAKLGSDMQKPKGLVEINKDNLLPILKKLTIDEMIFIGKRTSKRLKDMNIFSLYDLYSYNPKILVQNFGVMGQKIFDMVHGENDDEILEYTDNDTKSVGNGLTAAKDLTSMQEVKNLLSHLADMVSTRMRRHKFKAKTIHLTIKFADFSYLGAQKTFSTPFSSREHILNYSLIIFKELTNNEFNPIRALRISCSKLEINESMEQLNFLVDTKREKLGEAVDAIREKYGDNAITTLNDIDEI